MKKALAVILVLVCIGLSVLWIIHDPGFSAVFSRSVIFIGFIPIPGLLFGLLIQLIPAILGFVGAGSLWNS
jgi:hypothetical protein